MLDIKKVGILTFREADWEFQAIHLKGKIKPDKFRKFHLIWEDKGQISYSQSFPYKHTISNRFLSV